jgi:hypothetical protein
MALRPSPSHYGVEFSADTPAQGGTCVGRIDQQGARRIDAPPTARNFSELTSEFQRQDGDRPPIVVESNIMTPNMTVLGAEKDP